MNRRSMVIWGREREGAVRIRRKREVGEARNHSYRTVGKYSCTVLYCILCLEVTKLYLVDQSKEPRSDTRWTEVVIYARHVDVPMTINRF